MPRQVGPTRAARDRLAIALATLLLAGSACTTFGFDPDEVEVARDTATDRDAVAPDASDAPTAADTSETTPADRDADVDTVEPNDPVLALAAGDAHTCALRQGGTVACWGRNDRGQLGDGTKRASFTPVVVTGLTDIVAIDARRSSTCAVHTDGRLLCWGANDKGQLGDGTTSDRDVPTPVIDLADVRAVALGDEHGCAIHGDAGAVRCWGRNDKGQLGDDTSDDQPDGTHVVNLSGARRLAAGHKHTCAATDDDIHCWGLGDQGQLGGGDYEDAEDREDPKEDFNDHKTPQPVRSWSGAVVALSAGDDFTCAVEDDGTTRCWGRDDRAQLQGRGTTSIARQVATGATDVAAGSKHVCVRNTDASIDCWGDNADGQLGTSHTTQLADPARVAGTPVRDDGGLVAGKHHTCAAAPDGETVACWGRNDDGQLGIADLEDQLVPVEVPGL